MTVVETSDKIVHVPRLRAETVNNKVGDFWQTVLASITTVQYPEFPVNHFLVDQPHQSFLTLIDIVAVSALGKRPMVSVLRKLLRNTLLHADAILMASRKTPMLPI